VSNRDEIERVGPHYDLQMMAEVRRRTRAAINKIAAAVEPGMVEEDAVLMARNLLKDEGLLRGWHGTYVRFGRNTVKIYGEASEPGMVLGEDDIFLVDIGPVFQRWEGDGGDTFVTGDDADKRRCANDCKRLFNIVRAKWREEQATGQALYDYAEVEAGKMGWELNLDLAGHRLSDFPHSAIFKGSLRELDFSPSPRLWVLEMHIRHPEGLYGAFYEDMLLEEAEAGLGPLAPEQAP